MSPPRRIVLIVEDDEALRRMYRVALTFAGFEVREAGDGLSALAALDRHPPDVVVLDLSLPSISGQAVRAEIASGAMTRQIPVVIVTGSTENLDHLDVPCILRKPVTPHRLADAVQRCVASGSAGTGRS